MFFLHVWKESSSCFSLYSSLWCSSFSSSFLLGFINKYIVRNQTTISIAGKEVIWRWLKMWKDKKQENVRCEEMKEKGKRLEGKRVSWILVVLISHFSKFTAFGKQLIKRYLILPEATLLFPVPYFLRGCYLLQLRLQLLMCKIHVLWLLYLPSHYAHLYGTEVVDGLLAACESRWLQVGGFVFEHVDEDRFAAGFGEIGRRSGEKGSIWEVVFCWGKDCMWGWTFLARAIDLLIILVVSGVSSCFFGGSLLHQRQLSRKIKQRSTIFDLSSWTILLLFLLELQHLGKISLLLIFLLGLSSALIPSISIEILKVFAASQQIHPCLILFAMKEWGLLLILSDHCF